MQSYNSVEEYINSFPKDTQAKLIKIRQTIQEAAPGAKEKIAYGIPTFTFHGNLVHYAAFKTHIGFYPAPSGIEAFEKELAPYKTGKGTIQFPLNKEIPYDLIKKVVKFRMEQNFNKGNKELIKKK